MNALLLDADLEKLIRDLQVVRQAFRVSNPDYRFIRQSLRDAIQTANRAWDSVLLTPEHDFFPEKNPGPKGPG